MTVQSQKSGIGSAGDETDNDTRAWIDRWNQKWEALVSTKTLDGTLGSLDNVCLPPISDAERSNPKDQP